VCVYVCSNAYQYRTLILSTQVDYTSFVSPCLCSILTLGYTDVMQLLHTGTRYASVVAQIWTIEVLEAVVL